jgi:hypothetical protein
MLLCRNRPRTLLFKFSVPPASGIIRRDVRRVVVTLEGICCENNSWATATSFYGKVFEHYVITPLLLCIRKVPGSNLGWEVCRSVVIFCFLLILQAVPGILS